MNKKTILVAIIAILFCIIAIGQKCYAVELDRIENYVVTVDPRMTDGTLDITYEITWRVLDSTSQGPLEWVQIGTANSYFDNPQALTSNIKKIKKYSGTYVKIDFKKKYYAGESVTFKYKLHQSDMHILVGDTCTYSFTPAWFTDAKVDNMTVRWNKDRVKSSNSKITEDNYLVWNKTNMSKGEKLMITAEYDKTAFSSLKTYDYVANDNSNGLIGVIIVFVIMFSIPLIIVLLGNRGNNSYYSHSGFYSGGYYGSRRHRTHYRHSHSRSSCVRSSCACARSSCACACAGSGRAGCSKKDFYGTKLTKEKIEKVIEIG